MAEEFRLSYQDLSGGLNLGPQPADIQDNEQSSLVNYHPVGPELRRRPGFDAISEFYSAAGTNVATDLTALHAWRGDTPSVWDLFGGAVDSIARWNYATGLWERVPRIDTSALFAPYPSSEEPWQIVQYRGVMYFFRRDVGMRRVQRSPYQDSKPGIAPPTAAPTLGTGGAGAIPTDSFQGVVTFYNTRTDAESNPSPYSNVLAHVGPAVIDWTNLPITSPTAQANAIRLYRSLPGETGSSFGAGAFYRVATLPLGTASYTDNLLVDQLGPAVRFDNAVPPPNLRGGVIWQERLWAHDGRTLYVSGLAHPEGMSAVNTLQVLPDDNQEIIGLAADETRLFVGKSRSVLYFTGEFPNLQRHTLDENNGVASPHTMRAVGGRLIWRSAKDVLVSEGGPGRSLVPNKRLRTYMKNIIGSQASTEVAAALPEQSLYLWLGRFSAQTPGQLKHPHEIKDRDVLVLNYETGAWGVWRFDTAEAVPRFFLPTLDQDGQEQLYLAWGPYLERADPGLHEDDRPNKDTPPSTTPLPIEVQVFGREMIAPPGHQIVLRQAWLDSELQQIRTGTSARFRIQAYRNGRYGTEMLPDTPHLAPPIGTSVTPPARDVRMFSLPLAKTPASKWLVGFTRSGISQAFDIFGFGLIGSAMQRLHRPEV